MTTDRTGEAGAVGAYAEVNGINLYYETHGTGRPLILLHGGLMSGETFGPVLPALAQDHQVVVVDLQGHGRTADIDRPIDVRLMADDIAALIDHLGLDKPDIVGYSLGGGVALFTAVKYPEKIRKLVDELLSAADVVTVHVPLTRATQGLIDHEAMTKLEPGSIVLERRPRRRDRRGGSRRCASISGHLGGAGIDVFERKPPKTNSPLLDAPNTLLTPHLGAWTGRGSGTTRVGGGITQVLDVLAGRSARYAVNAPLLTPETARAISTICRWPRCSGDSSPSSRAAGSSTHARDRR